MHRTSQPISSHWCLDFSVTISVSEWERRYKSQDRTGAQEELMLSWEKRKQEHPLWQLAAEGRVSPRRVSPDDGWQRTNQVTIKHSSAKRNSGLVQLRTFTRFIRRPWLAFLFWSFDLVCHHSLHLTHLHRVRGMETLWKFWCHRYWVHRSPEERPACSAMPFEVQMVGVCTAVSPKKRANYSGK